MGSWIPGGRAAGHRCPRHRYGDSLGDGREIGLDALHVGSYVAPPMNPHPVPKRHSGRHSVEAAAQGRLACPHRARQRQDHLSRPGAQPRRADPNRHRSRDGRYAATWQSYFRQVHLPALRAGEGLPGRSRCPKPVLRCRQGHPGALRNAGAGEADHRAQNAGHRAVDLDRWKLYRRRGCTQGYLGVVRSRTEPRPGPMLAVAGQGSGVSRDARTCLTGWRPWGAGYRAVELPGIGARVIDTAIRWATGVRLALTSSNVGAYRARPMNPHPVQNAIPVAMLMRGARGEVHPAGSFREA